MIEIWLGLEQIREKTLFGRAFISKGPKYRFPSNIDSSKCRREIAASLNDFIDW